MKATSGLQKDLDENLCPGCGKKLEQFLVKPIFSVSDNYLQALNVACPRCGVGADIKVSDLTQSLVQRVARPPK